MTIEHSTMLLRPPRRLTIVESIIDEIVQQVQNGALKPGDRLPSERQLIAMLGVSRSSVREALQGLMVMGLIETRPGQGTLVTSKRLLPDMSSASLSLDLQREMRLHLVEARRAVESHVARLAALRRTAEEATRLMEIMDVVRHDYWNNSRKATAPNPHQELHLEVAVMAHNPFFTSVVEDLLQAVPYALHLLELNSLDDQGRQKLWDNHIAIHAAIAAAVCEGDGDAAFNAMSYHYDYEASVLERLGR